MPPLVIGGGRVGTAIARMHHPEPAAILRRGQRVPDAPQQVSWRLLLAARRSARGAPPRGGSDLAPRPARSGCATTGVRHRSRFKLVASRIRLRARLQLFNTVASLAYTQWQRCSYIPHPPTHTCTQTHLHTQHTQTNTHKTHAQGPIWVCTTNDGLDGVLAMTPPARRPDLIFVQNGMLLPWLVSNGLGGNTQVLLYMAGERAGAGAAAHPAWSGPHCSPAAPNASPTPY